MLGIRVQDPVGRLVTAPTATVRPSATLREATHSLAADGLGLLVVVDPNGVHGVLSERDVIRAVAEGGDLDEERVRDHATEEIVTVADTTSVLDAATAMTAAEVRHLAVTQGENIIGVVSVRDLVAVFVGAFDAAPV